MYLFEQRVQTEVVQKAHKLTKAAKTDEIHVPNTGGGVFQRTIFIWDFTTTTFLLVTDFCQNYVRTLITLSSENGIIFMLLFKQFCLI